MDRLVLAKDKVDGAISGKVGGEPEYRQTVAEVAAAIDQYSIVVVGMRHNPYPKKACQLLERKVLDYHYMEYGSYFSEWKRRGALKMWSGWQTLPMIFIDGQLIGGFKELEQHLSAAA